MNLATFKNLAHNMTSFSARTATSEIESSLCGIVLGEVSPEARRADPRAESAAMLRAAVDEYPEHVEGEERPQRRVRPARSDRRSAAGQRTRQTGGRTRA